MIRPRYAAFSLAALLVLPLPGLAGTQPDSLAYDIAAPTLGRLIMAIHDAPLPSNERSAGQALVFAYGDALRRPTHAREEAALQNWIGSHLRSQESQLRDTVQIIREIADDPTTASGEQFPSVAKAVLESAMPAVPGTLAQTLEGITALSVRIPAKSTQDLRILYLMSAEVRHCQASLIALHDSQLSRLGAPAAEGSQP